MKDLKDHENQKLLEMLEKKKKTMCFNIRLL